MRGLVRGAAQRFRGHRYMSSIGIQKLVSLALLGVLSRFIGFYRVFSWFYEVLTSLALAVPKGP